MKTIIAGSRTFTDYRFVAKHLDRICRSGFHISKVVSGKEPNGVDRLGEAWAKKNKIPIKPFPADWNKFGLAAGPIRNAEMAWYADALIAFWDGKSPGTRGMIRIAKARRLVVIVIRFK